jgi:hypothetical protein
VVGERWKGRDHAIGNHAKKEGSQKRVGHGGRLV